MNVDQLQEFIAAEGGMERWRREEWPESTSLTSRVSAHQYRKVVELLNRYASEDTPIDVLDWGSGSAAFSYVLAMEGHRVSATDFAEPPMEEVIAEKSEGRFTFTKAIDPVKLPYDDDSFDVVLSIGCLEHVRETGGSDTGSLEEIRRVLRPGGVFICAHLPNRYSYIEAYVRLLDKAGRHYHRFRYSKDEIVAKARDAGLEVLQLEAYGAIPRNPLAAIPERLRDSESFIRAVDAVDDTLAAVAGPICQNFVWVGRKPA